MFVQLALSVFVGATATATEPPSSAPSARIKVAVLEIKALDPALKPTVTLLQEVILADLAALGNVDAIGQSDIAAMLGLERQKQLLGCADDSSSCLAELGGALGAQYVLLGTLASLGNENRIDLKLLDVHQSRVLGRQFANAATDGALVQATRRLLQNLVRHLPGVTALTSPPAAARASEPIPWHWVAIGTGAALAVGGGTWAGVTSATYYSQRQSLRITDVAELESQKNIGLALAGVGLVAAGVGTWLWLAPPRTAVTFVPVEQGAVIAFGGTL